MYRLNVCRFADMYQYTDVSILLLYKTSFLTRVTQKLEPLLAHFDLGDALPPQLRVDGGELAADSGELEHLLDIAT